MPRGYTPHQFPFWLAPSFEGNAVPVTPLDATLIDHPVSVANKQLTQSITPLDATLTKNTGVGARETELATTGSLALFCRSLHQECFTSLLQSIPSTLFLKTAGVSPNNSHSETRHSPLITRHCIQVLSAHTLTNAPSRKPLRLTSLQMPGGYGGCAISIAPSCRSLHQEWLTTLLHSGASTLFLKNACVSPIDSQNGNYSQKVIP